MPKHTSRRRSAGTIRRVVEPQLSESSRAFFLDAETADLDAQLRLTEKEAHALAAWFASKAAALANQHAENRRVQFVADLEAVFERTARQAALDCATLGRGFELLLTLWWAAFDSMRKPLRHEDVAEEIGRLYGDEAAEAYRLQASAFHERIVAGMAGAMAVNGDGSALSWVPSASTLTH